MRSCFFLGIYQEGPRYIEAAIHYVEVFKGNRGCTDRMALNRNETREAWQRPFLVVVGIAHPHLVASSASISLGTYRGLTAG